MSPDVKPSSAQTESAILTLPAGLGILSRADLHTTHGACMDLERQGISTMVRAFAWVLLLAAPLPFDFYGPDSIWPWSGLLDAGWLDGLGLVLPAIGAGWFFCLGRRDWSKPVLCAALLASFVLAWLVAAGTGLGPHPLAVFGHLTDGLPALFGRSLWMLMGGGVLMAAGLRLGALGFCEAGSKGKRLADPWTPARILMGAGAALTFLFYLLPFRGVVPLVDLLGAIAEVTPRLGDVQGIALLSGHVLSIGPLIFAGLVCMRLMVRPKGYGGALAGFCMAFVPGLCLLIGLRYLPFVPGNTLVHLRSAALLLVMGVGGAITLAGLIRGLWFQIPWTFGRLTRMDNNLAVALASPDPDSSLRRSLARLHPLVRLTVRRRLSLWRSAAAQVPGARQADLSAVIRFLERRWREERSVTERDASDRKLPTWPGWMRGAWLNLAGISLILLVVGIGLAATQRADPGRVWTLGEAAEPLARVFTEQLPAVVLDLSEPMGDFKMRAAYRELMADLASLEPAYPGLTAGIDELIGLGRYGRHRLHRIRRSRDRLNRLLRDLSVPFYVRSRVRAGDPGERDLFYLFVYHIQACLRYRARGEDQTYSVLHLRRADRLNVIEGFMGMTEEEETFVAVFGDRLEAFMGERLTEVVSRGDGVAELALAAMQRLGGTRADLASGLEGPLGHCLLEGLTRHELHHRWMGLNPEPPTALWASLWGFPDDAARAVSAEVGAYLGELGLRPAYARLRLAVLLDALARPDGRRGAHGRARAFVVEQLLGEDLADPLVRSKGGLERAAERLALLPDRALMARVARAHMDLFGLSAPIFERVDKP